MKHITVIIPTRNRLPKLLRCLAAIPQVPWVSVMVGCDGDHFTAAALCHPLGAPAALNREDRSRVANFYNPDLVLFNRGHIGSMRLCNLLAPMATDGILPLCDDMELHPGALEKARERFNEHFPDDDGVLGFHQTGIAGYAPTGLFLMGQRFLARYPEKQIFNPAYDHYGDVEIFALADKLGKFRFGGEDVAVTHNHEKDQTHRDGQRANGNDRRLRQVRQEGGLIWGHK